MRSPITAEEFTHITELGLDAADVVDFAIEAAGTTGLVASTGVLTIAVILGAGLGYGVGALLDDATGGGWGRFWYGALGGQLDLSFPAPSDSELQNYCRKLGLPNCYKVHVKNQSDKPVTPAKGSEWPFGHVMYSYPAACDLACKGTSTARLTRVVSWLNKKCKQHCGKVVRGGCTMLLDHCDTECSGLGERSQACLLCRDFYDEVCRGT